MEEGSSSVKDSTVINGFRTTGLCPWNPEAINYKKCLGKGNKNDEEPNSERNPNKDKVMTAETLRNIVGQDKFRFLQSTPLESLTETEKILKKICCYFDQNSVVETKNIEAVEFLNIDQLPIILAEDLADEIQTKTIIRTDMGLNESDNNTQLVRLDSQQFLLTPVKLQDVLITQKTPERKGVQNTERSSFVLTSAEWQKTENDKLKAKQLKEEEQKSRKLNRLLKQEEKKSK